jgi:hypothetical protein
MKDKAREDSKETRKKAGALEESRSLGRVQKPFDGE